MARNKKLIITVISAIVLVTLISLTYAFYPIFVNNENRTAFELKTGEMELTFSDNDNGIDARLDFGESATKKFTITNTGSAASSLSLDWKGLVNTYLYRSMSYNLTYSETENGKYEEVIPETNIPTSITPINQSIASELSVPAGTTYYYNLTVTLNELEDLEQSQDLTAKFHSKFTVEQPSKYRYYTLTVDPNGGTWGEFTAPQEYLLKNSETKEITGTGTRTGYTFSGWKIQGTSSELNDTTFIMGISDTYLVAQWTPNKYNLTINLDGGSYTGDTNVEIEYLSSISLSLPTKKGYTFTGWNVTGGRVENNTFTLTDPNNASLTATWQINNYKYIVYHNQMNIDGNGYSLVSADTDEGEAEYNSTVNLPVKTYTGFTSPNIRSLTIDVEENYPPTKNVINYNYDRNKYYLTINTNGGTYTGTNPVEMYYGASTTLDVPTKTGYTFTSWSATSGTLNENTFTMNDSNAEVSANYTPKEYSVTFNANGGTVDTPSKKVIYDETYGTLPVPIYSSHAFLGWYTDPNGGIQITESTQVTITSNQTLYAHWVIPGAEATLANLGITPKTGTPNFGSAATSDEGVYSMADDYGTSYYYRGAVTNNYVKFANFYWRIIRVNGDGSIRMIYDGAKAYNNGINNTDRLAITNVVWNNDSLDAKYIGWMFGGKNGSISTSKEQAQKNETSSNIKNQTENWYKINIKEKGFEQYVSDEIFCNDRSTADDSYQWWIQDTAKGFGTHITAFGGFHRVIKSDGDFTLLPTPRFTCPNKNDAFTKDDTEKGNGNLEHPIGLITLDEMITAGSGKGRTVNLNYYLYKGTWYWSSSPSLMYSDSYTYIFYVTANGSLDNIQTNIPGSVAPVINLSPETSATLIGTGTMTDPFRLFD